MYTSIRRGAYLASVLLVFSFSTLHAQSAGTIYGTVTDPFGALLTNASITIENPVSHYINKTNTDNAGHYQFTNLPLNPYHLTIQVQGFSTLTQDVDVRSLVPLNVKTSLMVGSTATTIEVQAADLLENDSTFHTDVDKGLFDKLPLESASSSLSALVTFVSPGIAADSNGLFHGLGDHASNSFSIDGQPITDQQSKVFSNQIPSNSVQSLEVISGAPPAEFGGKTSVVIEVTTRSGQGVTKPTGSVTASYGTFGSATGSVDLSYGGQQWGNFIEIDGLNTGRFLDPPEFTVFHDKGNEINVFDRIDRNLSTRDSIRLNLGLSRSWFQTPNAYDNLAVQNIVSGGSTANPVFGNVGNADQRSKIVTFNVAPTYTRTIGPNSVFNFGAYVRRDGYNYYPSKNPLTDLGPIQTNPSLRIGLSPTPACTPTSATSKASITSKPEPFTRKPSFASATVSVSSTPLSIRHASTPMETPCPDSQIRRSAPPPEPSPTTASAGGSYRPRSRSVRPHSRRLALQLLRTYRRKRTRTLSRRPDQDRQLALQPWNPRRPLQRPCHRSSGRTATRRRLHHQANQHRPARLLRPNPRVALQREPRALQPGLRQCCARTSPVVFSRRLHHAQPGFRNEFHAGLQQAFGKNLVFSGDYIWKYTHNAFDFSVLGNTPITFPIDWHNSKIPGFALRD